jgi:hypothetical protein
MDVDPYFQLGSYPPVTPFLDLVKEEMAGSGVGWQIKRNWS